MSEEKYFDLLLNLKQDDLALDESGWPQLTSGLESIAQDIINAIRESGDLVNLVGERSAELRQLYIQQIILTVEDDERIVPGTVKMEYGGYNAGSHLWNITAETYEYGTITRTIEVDK